jgi:hypothetical protein
MLFLRVKPFHINKIKMPAWWKIITNGATIAEVARQIYNTLTKDKASAPSSSGDFRDLYQRLEFLEKNEIRQAELIKRMAEQMNELSTKAKNASTLAIISIVIAIISIVWQLLDK